MTKDGKPYAPIKYKQIVKEAYLISKNLNTPYSDVMNMTPTERNYILEFLVDDAQQFNKAMEENQKKLEEKRNSRKGG